MEDWKVCVASRGDAEEEAAKRCGSGSFVASEDLDALIYGAPRLISYIDHLKERNHEEAAKEVERQRRRVHPYWIELEELRETLEFTQGQLVEFAILCGCSL
ncbi:unnamed protein product [Durusdinium trenchii]|uniref:XPG-I domain-containing protein n=1 Tax=Durusdinium trenchii TaxID=1381693 RepID=A0ABP0RPJ3_9DINO